MESNKPELPLCLIESNILPRLPAKSLGRCMCVCKQWKSFLSTPTFARIHLRHITIDDDEYKLLLLDGQPPATTFSTLDCNNDHGPTTIIRRSNPDPSVEFILASLDGLVCLGSTKPTFHLAFWNPLTGAYKKLSSSHSFQFSAIPCKNAVGFYMDSSNDYKLVYLNMEQHHRGAYIYSLRLDSWKEIDFAVGFRLLSGTNAFLSSCRMPMISIDEFYALMWRRKLLRKDDVPHKRVTVLEDNESFRNMNTEEFIGRRRDSYRFHPHWVCRSRRMIYVETLVSPAI